VSQPAVKPPTANVGDVLDDAAAGVLLSDNLNDVRPDGFRRRTESAPAGYGLAACKAHQAGWIVPDREDVDHQPFTYRWAITPTGRAARAHQKGIWKARRDDSELDHKDRGEAQCWRILIRDDAGRYVTRGHLVLWLHRPNDPAWQARYINGTDNAGAFAIRRINTAPFTNRPDAIAWLLERAGQA
jgi:hypothetical protein